MQRVFLEKMEARIGVEQTLKRIQAPSYFRMSYVNFKDIVSLYEEYIGVEGVTQRLNRSLGGFDKGNVEAVRAVITYLQIYFGGKEEGKLAIQQIMKKNLRGFSNANKK